MEIELREVYNHPFVQELIQQNEQMASQMPERQHLSNAKKISLDHVNVPHTIKNRLLFQAGTHNGLEYLWEDIKKPENYSQWEGLDLFRAEHDDKSDAWIGFSKNIKLNEEEQAIYGDLEVIDPSSAKILEFQVLKKDGRMGISPTLDVDKQMLAGREVAGSPWNLQSQSIVLKPAVRTTIFNSEKNGGNMKDETKVQLKDGEVAISQKELTELQDAKKRLANVEAIRLKQSAEELAKQEITLGRIKAEQLSARTEELNKLSDPERARLKETYDWLTTELSDKSEEELFMEQLPEELKGNIPPGLRAYIDSKKKKGAVPAEKMQDEEDLEEQENAGYPPFPQKKKYPYPENNPRHMMSGEPEKLSEKRQKLVEKKSFNKFQELSEATTKANEDFIEMMNRRQGTSRRAS